MLEPQDSAHAHEDDLEMYIRGRLEPKHISVLNGHLLKCDACRDNLSSRIGLQLVRSAISKPVPDQTNRRSEPRFHTGDDAIVQELNPLSLDRQIVKIVDISQNGIGILAPNSVSPGTLVQIKVMNNVEFGEVRHSSAWKNEGYRIGLRLHLVS